MYVGQDIPLDDLIAQGVNKGTCDQLLQRITGVYALSLIHISSTAAAASSQRPNPSAAETERHSSTPHTRRIGSPTLIKYIQFFTTC